MKEIYRIEEFAALIVSAKQMRKADMDLQWFLETFSIDEETRDRYMEMLRAAELISQGYAKDEWGDMDYSTYRWQWS